MRWGKLILLFQAVITLIIGIAFFSQLTVIGASDVSEIVEELTIEEEFSEGIPNTINNIKIRFTIASYILFIVGLVEIIIIIRLFS